MTILAGLSGAASGFAAATLGAHGIDGRVADKFSRHQTRYEELTTVIVELDGGTFGIRFGDDSETILLVLNLLSSGKNLHVASLSALPLPGPCFPRTSGNTRGN
jgi:hypothetical protein